MVYHEDLDERSASTPSPGDFTVEVEGDDVDVDDVEVDRDEVILTLESPVGPDDDVRLSYDHGVGLLQDEAGNVAGELRRERVDNITDQAAGTPGPPRSLTGERGRGLGDRTRLAGTVRSRGRRHHGVPDRVLDGRGRFVADAGG